MEERLVNADFMFVSNDQSTEVGDPGDTPFHLPASLVPSQFPSVLGWRFTPVGFVRADQIDPTLLQSLSQRIGVAGLIVDQTRRILPRSTATPGDADTL